MTDPIALDARTARHALPMLYPGQAQKEAFVNEALARLDALAHSCVLATRDTPPLEHIAGDAYLVGAQAAGEWAGREGAIAISQGTHWLFQSAREGMMIYDADRAAYRFRRGAWTIAVPVSDPVGGSVVDTQARDAIATLLALLRAQGIVAAN